MLAPQHPTPVGRRRAVAEMSVAYQQQLAIEPGHVYEMSPPTPEQEAALHALADLAPLEPPVRFTVVYGLREYLDILGEHLASPAFARSRPGKPVDLSSWHARLCLRVMLPLLGAPIFLAKKRRMPVCRFEVDPAGLVRRAAGGTLRVAWSDVLEVHRYQVGYLIRKADGALPIPYRCLDEARRAAFERLLSRRDAAA